MTEEGRKFIAPGPVAAAFMRSNSRHKLICGPVGSGKSVACASDFMDRAMFQKPNKAGKRKSRWGIVRNTYGELKLTTLKTWKEWFGDFGTFIESAPFEHRVFGPHPSGDGTEVQAEFFFMALDMPKDVKKLLSFDATGIYFNELREIKKEIVDAADMRVGRYPPVAEGGPSWYGIIADTNMADEEHWLYAEAQRGDPWDVFTQPGGVTRIDGKWVDNPNAENIHNLIPGYYTNQLAGKSEEFISVYLGAEWGRVPDEGAYFVEEMKAAERSGRIRTIAYDPSEPVHTFWDLGLDDYMAIWCGQSVGGNWYWLHYYENTGLALGHYASYLSDYAKQQGWKNWGRDVWPHDGTQRIDGVGERPERRCDIWRRLTGRDPKILERAFKGDQIEAARKLIGKSFYDQSGCIQGLKHLRRYAREFDAARNVFKPEPRHDEHSHCADAHMTAAMGQKKISNDIWGGNYTIANNGLRVA